jgi:hypothetical protein
MPGDWQERSLARLGRSLKKIARAAGLEGWRAGFDILRTAHDADGS